MIAMCRGAAVAGNPEDALDVEMRIEAGQFLDCPRDLVDQAKHRLFSLPGIAEQARHESGFGGKFGAQRLACEKGVTSEAAGGPFYYMLNSLLLKTPRHALVCLLESRKLAGPLNPS